MFRSCYLLAHCLRAVCAPSHRAVPPSRTKPLLWLHPCCRAGAQKQHLCWLMQFQGCGRAMPFCPPHGPVRAAWLVAWDLWSPKDTCRHGFVQPGVSPYWWHALYQY
jgi:hypothetical protein